MRTAPVLTPDDAVLRAGRDDANVAAARPSVRRWLVTFVAKLIAAHRARQLAAVHRALRSGLAAID